MGRIVLFNPRGNPIKPSAVIKFLTVLVFFLFFFLSFLQLHVDNHDFWWHLATGKYIVETGSLPYDDPFSYTSHTAPSDRKSIILQGYWLAQVIFYKAYSLMGIEAIAVLRSLLMLVFLLFVFLNVKNQTASDVLSLIFASVIFLIAVPYSADRPQLFTFLIFSMGYYLLEDFRTKTSRNIFLFPVLVMILANMHPGYIVCLLLISVYLFASGIRHFIMKDYEEGLKFRRLLTIWILSILLSALNPTGVKEFKSMLHIGEYIQGIVEFMPTFYLFAKKLVPLNYPYLFFLSFAFLAIIEFRKIGLTHILLLIVFSIMSFFSIRYVIFFMCVSAPIIAKTAIIWKEKGVFAKPVSMVNTRKVFFHLLFFILGVFLVFHSLLGLARYELKADFLSAAPKGAADFLETLPVKGNMLNEYGFGGYLIWRLYPEKKVFIDGRALEPDVYNEYMLITLTKRDQTQSWEDIIKKYDIAYIVIPPLMYHGQIYPLVEALYDSDSWGLIYKDDLSLVFLHDDSRNISLVKRYAMDKKEVLNAIIIQALGQAERDRINPYYLISLGKTFMKMGKHDEAEKAFLKAYERDPHNPETNFWIQQLRSRRY